MKTMTKLISALFVTMLVLTLFNAATAEAASKKADKKKEFSVILFDPGTYKYVTKSGPYDGELKDGVPNGNGTFSLVNPQGYAYTISGNFVDGVPEGEIVFTFEEIEGLALTKRRHIYKNGLITESHDSVINGENWETIDIIKNKKGFLVFKRNSEGLTDLFYADDNGEFRFDSFADFYYAKNPQTGAFGPIININDETVFKIDKMRNASKSYRKKKAKTVSPETMYLNPEKYEGKLIKLDNAVEVNSNRYISNDDPSRMVLDRIQFMADHIEYTLFAEPGTVKYEYGKVVDLYFVPFGLSYNLLDDGGTRSVITGWIVGKPVKSAETEASAKVYRFAVNDYNELCGTFCGPQKDGKPDGFGVLTASLNDVTIQMIGDLYDDQPLNGLYGLYAHESGEYAEYTFVNGEITKGIVIKEEEIGDTTGRTYVISRCPDDGETSVVVYDKDEQGDDVFNTAYHMPLNSYEGCQNVLDMYFDSIQYYSETSDNPDDVFVTDYDFYLMIDNMRKRPVKEIRKAASKMSADEVFNGSVLPDADVIRLDNLVVANVRSGDAPDGKKYTEVSAEIDGIAFSLLAEGKKKVKEGDVITAYFSYGGKVTLKAEGEDETIGMGYLYSIKKAK